MTFKTWFFEDLDVNQMLQRPPVNPTQTANALQQTVNSALEDPSVAKIATANTNNNIKQTQQGLMRVAQNLMQKQPPKNLKMAPNITPVDVANGMAMKLGFPQMGRMNNGQPPGMGQ